MHPDIAREQVLDQAARDVRAGRPSDPSIVDWIVRDHCFHDWFVQELRDVYADEHARLTTGSTELEVVGGDEIEGPSGAPARWTLPAGTPDALTLQESGRWLGPTTGPRTERLVVSVSTEELEQIEARARADGRTRSDWVRRTLLGDVQPGRAPSR